MPQSQGAPNLIPASLLRAVSLLVVHCSATRSGQFLSSAAPVVINHWHEVRGFRRALRARAAFNTDLPSIGYHYVVDIDGKVWTGRHLEEVGAHAYGHNVASVGICLVGGIELDAQYTPAQWEALAWLVRQLQALCDAPLVVGHRDLSADANGDGKVQRREWLRTCPGFDVATWLARGMQPLPEHVLPTPQRAA